MPLIECPDCKKQISELAKSCPNCGRPMKIISSTKQKYESKINQNQFKSSELSTGVEDGIRQEKTKEAIGIYFLIGVVIIYIILGNTVNFSVGVIALFVGLFITYKICKR